MDDFGNLTEEVTITEITVAGVTVDDTNLIIKAVMENITKTTEMPLNATTSSSIGDFVQSNWPAMTITGSLTVVVVIVIVVLVCHIVKKQSVFFSENFSERSDVTFVQICRKGAYTRRQSEGGGLLNKICPCCKRKKAAATAEVLAADHGNIGLSINRLIN